MRHTLTTPVRQSGMVSCVGVHLHVYIRAGLGNWVSGGLFHCSHFIISNPIMYMYKTLGYPCCKEALWHPGISRLRNHRQTDRQTNKSSTIPVAAHAWLGYIIMLYCYSFIFCPLAQHQIMCSVGVGSMYGIGWAITVRLVVVHIISRTIVYCIAYISRV